MPIRTDPNPRAIADSPALAQRTPPVSDVDAAVDVAARPAAPIASRPVVPSRPLSARPEATAGRQAPRRPDPTSARLAVAAGGIATISALLAAIGSAAVPSAGAVVPPPTAPALPPTIQTVVRYVYVQPGQAAPAATVATVVAPPAPRAVPAPVVTRQSGAKP
jgi:hypothetical protein